jgi:hypothetical protein
LFNLTVVTDGDDNQDRFVELCQCSICSTKYGEKVHRGITIGGDADAGMEFVLEYIKTHNLNVRLISHSLTHSLIHSYSLIGVLTLTYSLIHLLTRFLSQVKLHIIGLGKYLKNNEKQRYVRASSATKGTIFFADSVNNSNLNGSI